MLIDSSTRHTINFKKEYDSLTRTQRNKVRDNVVSIREMSQKSFYGKINGKITVSDAELEVISAEFKKVGIKMETVNNN